MPNAAVLDAAAASITSPDTVYGPGAGHLDERGVGGNPYPYGECTWYVWQFYADTQRIRIPAALGNATDWVTSAHREQWAVDNQPVPSKAVCWSAARYPPFGHVAVVWEVHEDGTFDVLEMNFTYFAAQNPNLAGKIDLRTVKSKDGIQGFITPTGVTVSHQGQENDLLAALSTPFTSIGDAIRQAGLYLQAEAMTAEHKATAMGQVALGTLLTGGGLTLGVLTAYGRGRPGAGAARVQRQLRRTQRSIAPAPSPIGRRSYTETERRWLSPRAARQLAAAEPKPPAAPKPAPKVRPPAAPAPRPAPKVRPLARPRGFTDAEWALVQASGRMSRR